MRYEAPRSLDQAVALLAMFRQRPDRHGRGHAIMIGIPVRRAH